MSDKGLRLTHGKTDFPGMWMVFLWCHLWQTWSVVSGGIPAFPWVSQQSFKNKSHHPPEKDFQDAIPRLSSAQGRCGFCWRDKLIGEIRKDAARRSDCISVSFNLRCPCWTWSFLWKWATDDFWASEKHSDTWALFFWAQNGPSSSVLSPLPPWCGVRPRAGTSQN